MAEGTFVESGPPAVTTYSPDGVHLLRTTQQVQYQLSQMADQKANMLLGAAFVIFSVSMGQARSGAPQLPLMILGGAAFIAAVLAVLAVLPSVKSPPTPNGPANVLFFGSFSQVPEAEYVEMLLSIVTDSKTVYQAFAHDIYQNGRVLSRKKYRFLGFAYRVLLAGLALSLAAFLAPYGLRLIGR
ncbi:MAG TPA: Pycsar system effector family protein [Phenylobacterium sp.]|nr:Pycsar system effector family protein [Phenylobacterium sp.]